ncbi:hypothetical protein [Brevundimonas lenta]|uniref:Uncharacterized protein n=1 Tax=Brevundimonas lenta TaxID=424796 RepID=A0A7W6JDE6_9CAUL|nr:hypothetical protein [Brevundimonas lenta]MBB4083006.1 hypothetical protein [Brevundimonas lenta]
MHRADGVFTPRERRTALLALLGAALITLLGFTAPHWMRPSLGGMDSYQSEAPPGVMDARPAG